MAAILNKVDLTKITVGQVKVALEAKFEVDLRSKKKFIKETVLELIAGIDRCVP